MWGKSELAIEFLGFGALLKTKSSLQDGFDLKTFVPNSRSEETMQPTCVFCYYIIFEILKKDSKWYDGKLTQYILALWSDDALPVTCC